MAANNDRIEIPKFDGDAANFGIWWERFVQYGRQREFDEALKTTPETDLPVDPTATNADAAVAARNTAAVTRNNKAHMALSLALPDKLVLVLARASKTDTHYPKGKACLMIAKLFKKYRKSTALSSMNMLTELQACSMNKWDDPEVLFEQIDAVIEKYTQMGLPAPTADNKLTYIIRALPDTYSNVITSCTSGVIDDDTIDELLEAAQRHHVVLCKGRNRTERPREIENALSGIDQQDTMKQLITMTIDAVNSKNAQTAAATNATANAQPPNTPANATQSAKLETLKNLLGELGLSANPPNAQAPAVQRVRGPMICYKCGGEDHRANTCTNAPNPSLVTQKLHALGRTECKHCGGWHRESGCWLLLLAL